MDCRGISKVPHLHCAHFEKDLGGQRATAVRGLKFWRQESFSHGSTQRNISLVPSAYFPGLTQRHSRHPASRIRVAGGEL